MPNPKPTPPSDEQSLDGYQLRVVREVLLALLAAEPSHGYQLRARLALALGPLAGALNDGQVYVTLSRLEKAGLVTSERVGQADKPDRKVYELTPAGRDQVTEWLEDTSWPKPAPAEFHLKLVAAAAAGLADPVGIVDQSAPGAVARARAGPASGSGRAGRVGRRASARGRRAEAAGGSALARSLRAVLERGEGAVMQAT